MGSGRYYPGATSEILGSSMEISPESQGLKVGHGGERWGGGGMILHPGKRSCRGGSRL